MYTCNKSIIKATKNIRSQKVVSHMFLGQLCKQSDLYSQQGNQEILKCTFLTLPVIKIKNKHIFRIRKASTACFIKPYRDPV